ncbi:MAG: efflux RND transporter periplasmic adaptor subunit [Gammaproteobacteria bacterium]|nr:efflux RND transporter periplasmic adaptor subunit [Gammaproteobacteria bacterium]NNK31738.1 efflux RND transporter periplasmic adaptor subunit [Xanthomonadales bacterium]
MSRTFPKRMILLACLLLAPVTAAAQLQVRVAPVVSAPIVEELPLSGSVLSPRYSDLTTQVNGLVIEMLVDVGDRVEAGDVLLRLDSRLTQLELERLLAREEEARLSFQDAKRLADEGRRLIADRNISNSQYESRLAEEALQQSRLQQLDAEVRKQRVTMEWHELRAPFAGVIGVKHVEVGEWVNAGSPALQLVQMDPLRVQVSVPERYYPDVRPGTPVKVSVDALPGRVISAPIESVVASARVNTRSFLAWLDIANPEYQLAPGMSAHVVLALGGAQSKPVLQVPADAVVRRRDGSAVVWTVRDGEAQPVPVAVGRRNEQLVEVSAEGLAAGDPVVTLGNESLRPGQTVTAVPQ